MSKVRTGLIVLATALASPAGAVVLGPHAAECSTAGRPAMLVRVVGLKSRTGTIRVQTYGGDPAHFFDKGSYLERVEVPTPATGAVEVCMPVPRTGTYAVSVRHDVDGRGNSGASNGGGMSGNPNISLMDVLFKRKPSPAQVSVAVTGRTMVSVVMNYMQGASVRPIAMVVR